MAWKYNNPAPLETHREMGAAVKDAIQAVNRLQEYGRYMREKDVRHLITTADYLNRLRSHLENRLFEDNEILPASAFEVYYTWGEHGAEDGGGHVAG